MQIPKCGAVINIIKIKTSCHFLLILFITTQSDIGIDKMCTCVFYRITFDKHTSVVKTKCTSTES